MVEKGDNMKHLDVNVDGERLSFAAKLGYAALGFFLGVIGVLIAWAIGHRKKMMECSAEAIYLGIWGAAFSVVLEFVLTAAGVLPAPYARCTLIGAQITGRSIFWLVVAICFLILSSMWVYGMAYKQTRVEKATVFPGDDWIKPGEKHLRYDSGFTIEAPAERVWALVKQSGQTQAGWYSFDWLERLFTFDIHNHYDIHPEWQNLKPGDYQWFHQAPLSIGEWVTYVSNEPPYGWAAHSDTATDPGYKNPGPKQEKALKLWFKRFCWTWNWQVVPLGENRCRLLWRCDCTFERYHRLNKYFVVFVLGTASIVMGRGFMDVMAALAEGRLTYPDSKK